MFSLKASLPRPVQFAAPTLLLLAFSSVSRAQAPPGAELAHLRPQPQSVGVADPGSTWPSGVIYYDDGGCIAGSTCPNLAQAISTFNADFPGVVQWTQRTNQTTYVVITLSGTGGRGDVDTIGFPAFAGAVNLNCNTDCSVATLLHEMGHIIGLYHEQTRTDRDSYITVNYNNVIKGSWTGNFAINTQNQQLLSPYDYASVMQYPSYVDSRNGGPVIETIPAGIPLQGTEGVPGAGTQDYSSGDKEAILRLYGAPPTTVVVTSNPVGLQVLVDSVPCTTPCQETGWFNSTHSLSVGPDVQTLAGNIENGGPSTTFYYTFGRWSDSGAQTHSVAVRGGDGSPAFPRTTPAIATYTANFIQLVPFTSTGAGTVDASPEPQTYTGDSSDVFLVARQPVTLNATTLPGGGSFYEYAPGATGIPLPGGLSANPKTFFVPDTGNPVEANAEFTSDTIYTVDVVPSEPITNSFSSNLGAIVDGSFYYTPKNFSPTFDPDWTAGSTTHTVNIQSPQLPYSVNTEFAFSSWSDSGAQSHGLAALSPDGATYTATVNPLYQPATNFSSLPPCGGSAAITPASSNGGFYPWGTQLTYTATPDPGWTFAGWTYDLTGTSNPASLTARDETLVWANFNVTNTPLAITSLSPPSASIGSSTFTLTINGTGFASNSVVIINGSNFPAVTFVNSTELQVQVDSSLVSSVGKFDVSVENFPVGSTGCAVFAYDTFAVTAAGGGALLPTINWTPAAEIVRGDAGTTVLNATTTPPDIGGFTYSTSPGGDVTGGTSSLAPGTYTLTATFHPTDPQYTSATASATLTVAGETVWIVNGGGGTSVLTGDGTGITTNPYPGAAGTIAIDAGGNVWTTPVGGGVTPLLEETSQVGTVLQSISTGGGLFAPWAIAIDGNGQVWVANANNEVSEFSNTGTTLSPSGGFTDPALATPSAIAVDLSGSLWVANEGSNSLVRFLGAAAPAAPLATAAKNNTTGAKP
jgi:hypothetical protein